jgi:parallel beta-helix repeat protein
MSRRASLQLGATVAAASAGALVAAGPAVAATATPYILVAPTGGDFDDIEEAIRQAPAGALIEVARGTYTVQAGVMSPAAGVTIRGGGYGTVIVARDGLNTNIFSLDNDNISLENLRIDGNGSNQSPSTLNCVRLTGRRGRISNCFVHDAAGYNIVGFPDASQLVIEGNYAYSTSPTKAPTSEGIELQGTSWSSVVGNVVEAVSSNGILIWNSTGDAHHNSVTGNTVRNCGTSGIQLEDGAHDNTISGNTCADNNWGIWINGNGASGGPRANTVNGNSISGSRNIGIQVTGSSDAVIDGNSVRANGSHGIWVVGSRACSVVGNTVVGNAQVGILLEDTTDSVCSANICRDNGQSASAGNFRAGIVLLRRNGTCARNTVAENRCLDSQSTPTQQFGIGVLGATGDNQLIGNSVDGNGSPGWGLLLSAEAVPKTHSVPFRRLTATVGTSQTAIAHGLPYTPLTVVVTPVTPGQVWRSAQPNDKRLFLIADRSCTVDLLVG